MTLNTDNNSKLEYLSINATNLTTINIANNVNLKSLDAINNPNLTSIHIWDKTFFHSCEILNTNKMIHYINEKDGSDTEYCITHIGNIRGIGYVDEGKLLVIPTTALMRQTEWKEANTYWKGIGYRLPSRAEATSVFHNKKALGDLLTLLEYTNYLESGEYWLSDAENPTQLNPNYYLKIYMSNGSVMRGSYNYPSFGIIEFTE